MPGFPAFPSRFSQEAIIEAIIVATALLYLPVLKGYKGNQPDEADPEPSRQETLGIAGERFLDDVRDELNFKAEEEHRADDHHCIVNDPQSMGPESCKRRLAGPGPSPLLPSRCKPDRTGKNGENDQHHDDVMRFNRVHGNTQW